MEHDLTAVEARVLGCLIEKERTTPEYYPLTLNGLTSACNQKSNRDPVMGLQEDEIVEALDRLRYDLHLVFMVTTPGSRVPKFRHDMAARLGLTDAELALMGVLLLRGAQTAGELRTRTARMHEFRSIDAVECGLHELSADERGALVVKLPRQTGCRERRFMHTLCGAVEIPENRAEPVVQEAADVAGSEDLTELKSAVEELRAEVAELRQQFDVFREQFE